MAKIQSVEPNIADLANSWLKSYKLDYKLEQESLNTEIDQALNDYYSKNGGVEIQVMPSLLAPAEISFSLCVTQRT